MPARALRWHLPAHVAMAGVMVLAMGSGGGALAHLLGGGALVVLALALAPVARRRAEVRAVLLDLCAMAAVLVALAMGGDAGGHSHGPAPAGIAAVAVIAWGGARIACTHGRIATASGALCGVQLAGMLVMALV